MMPSCMTQIWSWGVWLVKCKGAVASCHVPPHAFTNPHVMPCHANTNASLPHQRCSAGLSLLTFLLAPSHAPMPYGAFTCLLPPCHIGHACDSASVCCPAPPPPAPLLSGWSNELEGWHAPGIRSVHEWGLRAQRMRRSHAAQVRGVVAGHQVRERKPTFYRI